MLKSAPATLSFLLVFLLVCSSGCGNGPIATGGTSSSSLAFAGSIHGGEQPVAGASIQLYAVGTTADGSASTPLLTQPVQTDSNGNFGITGLYNCSSATLVYLVATGGNPGIGVVNPNLALMAALGPCSSLTANTFISVNEVTTVAAVSALAPFMTSLTAVGASTSDASALASDFALAANLANTATGTSPGTGIPPGSTVPSALINTLADAISVCVNSAGGTSASPTLCGELFALATPGSALGPLNTVDALLNLAKNPTLNTAALYALVPPSAPFQPALSGAPSDFRIALVPSAAPALTVTPGILIFPTGTAGVTSSPLPVQIQNTSGSAVSALGLSFTGADAGDFSMGNSCPVTLAAGASCTVQVSFTPMNSGPRIGYLSVASNSASAPQFVTLINTNAVPSVASLSPPTVPAGANSTLGVLVNGSNFMPSSVVQVNGVRRLSGYYSQYNLWFPLTTADQAAPGTLTVTVTNPGPGGGTSSASTFTVTAAAATPVITQVSPAQFTAGSPASTIQVSGPNLTPSSVVQWNGSALQTGYNYSSSTGYSLVGMVPASLLANLGTASVTVDNASTVPTTSNALPVSIVAPPPPTLTSISTQMIPVKTAATLTLNGTNFTTSTVAQINGTALPTTFVTSTRITAAISASSIPAPGLDAITVSNAQGTTAPQNLTAYVPILNNSMVYDPVNGLFYLSVPSAAGAPYGNSIVSVDPVTGALGTPIPVGSEPNRMAITADGRYIWVALDGASSIRKVDVVAGTAGLQFSFATQGNSINTVAALAALPGATDSVVVSVYDGEYTEPTGTSLAIYDAGVQRSSVVTFATYANFPWSLVVNGTTQEIYGPGNVFPGGSYNTYGYNANGVTLKSSTPSQLSYAANNTDDVQIDAGHLYTSLAQVVDAETGSLQGTFYSSGSSPALGSVTVDPALGEAFILEGSQNAFGMLDQSVTAAPVQLGAFNTSTYSPTSAIPLALSIPVYEVSYQVAGPTGSRLTRWGANGLAYRGTGGFVSLRTSLVKDLSSVNADLGVTVVPSGSFSTGGVETYTATVTNAGPSAASGVSLTAVLPGTGILSSVTPSTGFCSGTNLVQCDLGTLANGSSASIVFQVLQTSAGNAVMNVGVSASENDPAQGNNQASATTSIQGGTYSVSPSVTSIAPAAIPSGSGDTILTVTGSNFSNLSTVLLNGNPLPTSFTSATALSATVPASALATLGWSAITVTTPAPGGGTSTALPLTVFSVLDMGANHILYDPYSRKIMASIGAGSSSVAANSLVAITPETASVGTATPINGTPTNLALTSDGQILYALVPSSTSGSVARFNMLTQQPDYTVSGLQATGYNVGLRDIATQPGTENTVAIDEGEYPGTAIFDFNPANQSVTKRGVDTGIYTGTCLAFKDASTLFLTDLYSSGELVKIYDVTGSGLTKEPNGAVLAYQACYKLDGSRLYSQIGGVADTTVTPPVEVGTFAGLSTVSDYGVGIRDFAPDTSLGLAFYLTGSGPDTLGPVFNQITAFNTQTFSAESVLPVSFGSFEGNSEVSGVDVVRWGQDGLAILTSTGHVYLLRGGAVVPQLLATGAAASLTSLSANSATHGAGNLTLTLVGSNFQPGVAALWNGSYRTTTIVDATHLSMAIPASDLLTAGSAFISVVNPGAPASSSQNFTIQ